MCGYQRGWQEIGRLKVGITTDVKNESKTESGFGTPSVPFRSSDASIPRGVLMHWCASKAAAPGRVLWKQQ
jgi:hypothetical protein